MSRTNKGAKGSGFEYWTARPGNRCGGHHSTRAEGGANWQKKATHKAERQQNKYRPGDETP